MLPSGRPFVRLVWLERTAEDARDASRPWRPTARHGIILIGTGAMTKLLQRAFDEAQRLPEAEQDSLGQWLLHELEAEKEWEALLTGSADALGGLADEALAEHRDGRTAPLDPDRL
jgi:hypothetical protein